MIGCTYVLQNDYNNTISLHIHHITYLHIVCLYVVRAFKIYSLSNVQTYNIVLWTIACEHSMWTPCCTWIPRAYSSYNECIPKSRFING